MKLANRSGKAIGAQEKPKIPAPAILALELAAVWAVVANYLCQNFVLYGIPMDVQYGVNCFLLLLTLFGLLLAAKYVTRQAVPTPPKKLTTIVVCVIAIGASGYFILQHGIAYIADYHGPPHSDLTINTWTAERNNFDLHENPYTTRCQLWHDPTNKPHVTKVGNQLYMFGVPYDFGYAYFPAMFMTFEPFRHIESTLISIRLGNGVFYLLTFVAIGWLTALLVPPGYKAVAAILAIASFACNSLLGWQYFFLGTVDVVIPLFAMFGFIAAYYNKPVLAGILFGWCFACKLLPGGFICLIVGAWYWRRPERWKFWIAGLATFIVIVVPYILRNPPAFLSATVLYYLSEHAAGDKSALYYVVPDALKAPFLITGYAIVIGLLVASMRRTSQTLLGVVASCFVVFILFMASSKLAHDNYYFAIAPLGSVALIGYVFRNSGLPVRPRLQALEEPAPAQKLLPA